ncbi:MAG: radical SAM family heme chaperone HemW [Pseudomonadota bacterium]
MGDAGEGALFDQAAWSLDENPPRRAQARPSKSDRRDWRHGGFGVYVHWPFCQSRCPYCDFNSHVWREVDQKRWRAALLRELDAAYARAPDRMADTVFLGGGTPSLMPPETVAAVIERIDALWGLSSEAEITMEANPTSVEAGRFRGYRDAGVNRLSLGVQALKDSDLTALGRLHTAAEARAAFEVARSIFSRVSFDLIYARVGQSVESWRRELRAALGAAVDHLSLYQLTIEPGTRFYELERRGKLRTPEQELSAALYDVTQELCDAAGMPAYEVSNHARPGAESRHNLVYWRYGDYAGVGPGAHGRLTDGAERWATETVRDPASWLTHVERDGEAMASLSAVSPASQADEMLLMGLRLSEGVDLDRYARLAGAPLPADRIDPLLEEGFLTIRELGDGRRLAATKKGRPVLNALIGALAA